MKSVSPYLNFGGNCRDAIAFYQKCLGGEVEMNSYPDPDGKPSTDPHAKVFHSQLIIGSNPILMAADNPPGQTLQVGNSVSIAIDCESVEEIDRLYSALVENGDATMPLGNAPWGARFGSVTDQFGVVWLLNCALTA